jgi:hypothetical protein
MLRDFNKRRPKSGDVPGTVGILKKLSRYDTGTMFSFQNTQILKTFRRLLV